MRKLIFFISIVLSLNLFSKTAEEHYKNAEEYSEESKKHYNLAAVAFGAVILGAIFRHYAEKKED